MSNTQLSLSNASVLEEVAQHQHETPRSVYTTVRQVIEWPVALIMLVVFSPVILLTALAAKVTSEGSPFYTQVRLGRNGRPFRILKIRTMLKNAEQMTGAVWAAKSNDPRLTPIGQFLRDTHLDELPQLWNVLQGHMSLVGPRPERPEMVVKLERDLPDYSNRMLVNPGLTGLAQVRLPPDTDVNDVKHKLAYDLYYVRKVGMWMDIRVLLSTVFHIGAQALDAIGGVMVSRYSDEIEQRRLDEGLAVGRTANGPVAAAPAAPQQAEMVVHVVRPPSVLAGHTPEPARVTVETPRRARRPAGVNGHEMNVEGTVS